MRGEQQPPGAPRPDQIPCHCWPCSYRGPPRGKQGHGLSFRKRWAWAEQRSLGGRKEDPTIASTVGPWRTQTCSQEPFRGETRAPNTKADTSEDRRGFLFVCF